MFLKFHFTVNAVSSCIYGNISTITNISVIHATHEDVCNIKSDA